MADRVFVFDGDLSGFISALQEAQQEIDGFTEQVDEAGQELDEMGDKSEEAGKATEDAGKKTEKAGADMKAGFNAAAVAAVAAAAAVAGLVKVALDFTESANQIAKRAKEVGASAEEYQKLQGVLDLMTRGGIDASFVINTLARNVDEAAQGNEEYAASFRRLNINLDEFRKLTPTEQIATFADALDNVEDRAARAAISMELMGRQGKFLGPAFDEGGDAIRAAAQEIEDAGLISNRAAKQAEDLADASLLMGNTFEAVKGDILDPLIPKLEETAEAIQQIVLEARESGAIDELGEAIAEAFDDQALDRIVEGIELFIKLAAAIGKVVDVANAFVSVVSLGPDLVNEWTKTIRSGFQDWDGFEERLTKVAEALERVGLAQRRVNVDDFADPKLSAGVGPFADIPIEAPLVILERDQEDERTETRKKGIDERQKLEEEAAKEAQELREKAAKEEVARQERITGNIRAQLDTRFDDLITNLEMAGEALEDSQAQIEKALEEIAVAMEAHQENVKRGFTSTAEIVNDLWNLVADNIIQRGEDMTEAEKERAMTAFNVAKALALVEVAIKGVILIIDTMASTAGGWQEKLAAGVLATAEVVAAEIAVGAQPAPVFHSGVAFQRNINPDEFPAVLNKNEVGGILSPLGQSTVGGTQGVDALNRGQSIGGGGGLNAVFLRIGNRTTEAQLSENLRTGAGRLNERLRTLQPRRIGHRLPAGFGA